MIVELPSLYEYLEARNELPEQLDDELVGALSQVADNLRKGFFITTITKDGFYDKHKRTGGLKKIQQEARRQAS